MAYISKYSGEEIDHSIEEQVNILNLISNLQNEINVLKQDNSNMLNKFYPIGSIYTSINATSPAILFGGTWTQIKDTFLLTAGNTYTAGSTGGSATHTHTSAAHTHTTGNHTLTVAQIPSHRHTGLDIDNVYIFGWDTGSTAGYRMDKASLGSLTKTSNRITTGYTGNGQAHNHGNTGSTTPGDTGSSSNLPPYKVVYAWERTA